MTHSDKSSIFSCRNVYLRHARGSNILENVNIQLKRGEFYFLTGSSGAGKSTLLRAMSLSLPSSAGSMRIFGRPITQDMTSKARRNRALLRRRIGIVFQDYRLIDNLNLFDNTALPLMIHGGKRIAARVRELLRWVGLSGHEHRYPNTLSGGQQQRAAIARAVIAKPDLLLADEPTGSVDNDNAKRLLALFTALNNEGTTIVFATHDESLLRQDCPLIRLHQRHVTLYPPRDPTKIQR